MHGTNVESYIICHRLQKHYKNLVLKLMPEGSAQSKKKKSS